VKIVVVSPHRDDAAFSLGLTIHDWLAARHTVTVVNCFTRSLYAPYSDAESLHTNDRMSYVTALRQREDVAWQRQYGRGLTLVDLRLKDAPIRLRCSSDEVCSLKVNPEDSAIEKIRKALSGLSMDALVLPLAFGDHIDHLTTRDAAIACSADALPTVFYEDLPYVTRTTDQTEIDLRARELGEMLKPIFAVSAKPDVDLAVATKLRLALCYDSQIDDSTARTMADFCRHYGGRERLWANSAWIDLSVSEKNAEAAK
jgi:LmbE family N-acetylglucosaminyl deacetylase